MYQELSSWDMMSSGNIFFYKILKFPLLFPDLLGMRLSFVCDLVLHWLGPNVLEFVVLGLRLLGCKVLWKCCGATYFEISAIFRELQLQNGSGPAMVRT